MYILLTWQYSGSGVVVVEMFNGLITVGAVDTLCFLTRFNKIAIHGTPQMAVDNEAISLSRVYSYDSKCRPTCPYSMCNPP